MSQSRRTKWEPRAPRAKLGGAVIVLVLLESGRTVQAKLHQLSTSGGLLHIPDPLDEAIAVELLFHIGARAVRAKAKVMFPSSATTGWLQPFQFVDLSEGELADLDLEIQELFQPSTSQS
jgi:hypothetical protein